MVMAPDASSIMGGGAALTEDELGELNRIASGEYRRTVKENLSRDYVTMYHPDGTTSVVQLPPLGKTGKGRQDRIQKITHYMVNKLKNGQRWWFASPPPGWKPAPTPWRCPVQECTRAGGLKDLLNLWRHINNKHPGEKELYQGVLKAIQERLAAEVSIDLNKLLIAGDTDVDVADSKLLISEEEIAAAKFQDAASLLAEEPELVAAQVPPETFEPERPTSFCDCGWENKKGTKQGMAVHQRLHCPLRKDS